VLAGIGILVVLGFQLGAEPFVDALHGIGVIPVVIALAVTAVTTLCCARRWSLLAERLDVGVPLAAAFRAVYRAQFLNVTLPSGMVGEVDRALWHGHSSRAMSRGIRSVVWDRFTGQIVIFALVLLTLPALDPPVRTWMLWLLAGTGAVVVAMSRLRTTFTLALLAEMKSVPCARGVWPRVLVLSVLSAIGHTTLFVVAARAVGVDAPTSALVPVGLVIQQVAAIPMTVAGWGPREGATALIFGASGLGAEIGLEVSVVYGVLTTVGALPGILTLRRRHIPPTDSGIEQAEGGRSWLSARTQS